MAMVQCGECKNSLSTAAETCPHCGAPGPASKANKPAKKGGIGTIPGLIIAGVVLYGIAKLSGMSSSPAPKPNEPAKAAQAKPAEPPKPARQEWDYRAKEEEMTGKVSRTAAIASTNTFELGFPYGREQRSVLLLRNHPRFGRAAAVSVQRGQLLCRINDCKLSVRFDDAPPMQFGMVEAESNASEILFFSDYKTFASKLAGAKKVRVELKFFQQPAVVAVFDVEGFDPSRLENK